MSKLYKPTLIKDYGPHKKGEKYGWIDLEGYTNLFNNGVIEDEENIMVKKETKKTKRSKKEDKTEDNTEEKIEDINN